MERFYAIVKLEQEDYHFISYEYSSKIEFLNDLRANGYTIKHNRIYTEQEYKSL